MEKTLEAILELGEQIQHALLVDDLNTFYDLIEHREKLVDKLKWASVKSDQSQINSVDAKALENQFDLIIEALNVKEKQMMGQLRDLDKFKKAGQSYDTTKKRRQFINRDLLG